MATSSRYVSRHDLIGLGVLAGLAGGLAEILWISGFMSAVGGNAAQVASAVTATVAPSLAAAGPAVALGLVVHMTLAMGLGILVAVILRRALPRLAGTLSEAAILVAALAVVWATNFFVVLPVMNPAFVHIVPLPVSLASKLLFGVAAAVVFRVSARRRA